MLISIGFVIAIVVFLLLIMLSSLSVIIYLIGKHSVKNDPSKALIFLQTGNNIDKIYKGKLAEAPSKKGTNFLYDKDKFVMIPKDYKDVYIKNKRLIFIHKAGQVIASPLPSDAKIDTAESSNLIYEMCSTHIGADGMRALKGKSTANIFIIAIIAFVIGICSVMVFNQVSSQLKVRQQQSQQQQKPAQSPTIIEGR